MDVLKDKRFSGIVTDPRFKKIPTKHTKTKIDKRFHGLFSGKPFELANKRGSPLDHKIPEDYQKFYQLDEQDVQVKNNSTIGDAEFQEHDDKKSDGGNKDVETFVTNVEVENDSSDEDDDECKKDTAEESAGETEDVKTALTATKEPKPFSDENDSTTTDTETSDDEEEEEIDHHWQELDADAPRATDITRRLAVCNMDWDRLRAEDFFVVFNSFKPSDGVIHSIKVYPSEYGLQCMEKEKVHGPAELILDSIEDNATRGTNGSRFHREKLRQYQINRLKYFFAVVDCDSPRTADALYDHLNGSEFENSGCILDLRFIPDDMTFEQEPVSHASSFSCPSDYKPTCFVTSALNQVKFDLTWDETDRRRKEVLQKAFTDPEGIEKDLKEYFAPPSESEDEIEELEDTPDTEKLSSQEAIAKFRALVQTLEEQEKSKKNEEEFDMEVTWETGLKEKTEKLVKEKALKENLTPFEEVLQKKKELKKLKKEKRLNPQKEDDNSSPEEFELGESDDEQHKKKITASKGRKKNKFKLQEDSEADKKKLAELALLVAEPNDENFSDSDESSYKSRKKKKINQKKNKVQKEDFFVECIDDPRFAALYTNPLFHVDPSHQNLKEGKKVQAFSEVIQRAKYGDSNPVVASREISKKDVDFIGLKEKAQKPIEVENLKKKFGEFCKEFQKGKELKSLEKQRNGIMQKKEHSALMAETSSDTLLDFNCSKKRKKQKKVKKLGFPAVEHGDQMSSNNATLLNGSTAPAVDLEEGDDSDILIFSSGSTKKQTSAVSSKTPHRVNSARKKMKRCSAS